MCRDATCLVPQGIGFRGSNFVTVFVYFLYLGNVTGIQLQPLYIVRFLEQMGNVCRIMPLLLPSTIKNSAILELLFSFYFYLPLSLAFHSDLQYRISSKQDNPQWPYDDISIFKMTVAAPQFYFMFHIWCHHSLQKVSGVQCKLCCDCHYLL